MKNTHLPCKTIVYLATNTRNGKRYIGVTKKELKVRKYEHFISARTGHSKTIFSRAIKKYGEDCFRFEIVSVWPTYRDGLTEEIRLIAERKPEYNITIGGQGIFIPDRSHRKDWYRKVSKALKGRKPSALAVARWKEVAPTLAKRRLICLNDGFFGSVREAVTKYGVREKAVRGVCRGEWFATKGYFFIWAEGPMADSDRIIELNRRKEQRDKNLLKGSVARRKKQPPLFSDGPQ